MLVASKIIVCQLLLCPIFFDVPEDLQLFAILLHNSRPILLHNMLQLFEDRLLKGRDPLQSDLDVL